jgi:hypothetical protein
MPDNQFDILDYLTKQKSDRGTSLLIERPKFLSTDVEIESAQEFNKSRRDVLKFVQTESPIDRTRPIAEGLLNPKYSFQIYEEWEKTRHKPTKVLQDALEKWELCSEYPIEEIVHLLLNCHVDSLLYFDMLAYFLLEHCEEHEDYKVHLRDNLARLLEQFSLTRLHQNEALLSGIGFAALVSNFHQTNDVAEHIRNFPNLASSILEYAFLDDIEELSFAAVNGEQHLLFGLITQFSEVAFSNFIFSINHGCFTDKPEFDLPFFSIAVAEVVLFQSASNPFENEKWLDFLKILERHNLFSFPQTKFAHSLALRRIPNERTSVQAKVLNGYERLGIRPNNYSDTPIKFNDSNAQLLWENYVKSRSIFDPTASHASEFIDLTAIFRKTHELGQAMEYEIQWIANKLNLKPKQKHENRNKKLHAPGLYSIFEVLAERENIDNEARYSFNESLKLYNYSKHKKPLRDGSIDLFEKHVFKVFDALQKIKLTD